MRDRKGDSTDDFNRHFHNLIWSGWRKKQKKAKASIIIIIFIAIILFL